MRKHPVSIALSNDIVRQINQEALKDKRIRSDWLQMHFEALFSKNRTLHRPPIIKKTQTFPQLV